MKLKYIITVILVPIIAAIIYFMPQCEEGDQLKLADLARDITDPSRFISTDLVADRIIKEDPSLLLVDVRSFYDFDEFSIPGAINIPLEEILYEEWQENFQQPGKEVILFSNADILADQAWIMLRRANHRSIYVMKGGINCWFRTIMHPTTPPATAPSEEIDLYSFRKGARQHFLGGELTDVPAMDTETIQVERRKKKVVAEGGC